MNSTDWRIQGQEKYLLNKDLYYKKYVKQSDRNDHVHCEFCWDKFSEYEGDLHFGYNTLDGKYWICVNCFNDLEKMFNWKIIRK